MGKDVTIKFFAVGGTIDKVYFDRMSTYKVGEPGVAGILQEANVGFAYECESILRKDSLYMTDKDRQKIYDRVSGEKGSLIVITHGTDTMVETARTLKGIPGKVIVLTGAMQPARFKSSDAEFNIGAAATAVQLLSPGVYIVMNGRVLDPDRVKKNRRLHRFEEA
ncbi:MAG TPA: asparaginase domain-containing protein [Deltaproteobacteria bacterium]|jgi:L-asparaginase|nr:MAG: L-asparaginase 2 precursor [Deltaproteobacteria bacterium ADurb.Bin072]HNQ85371.1 asparaginase domain-containing protein [Deltaproteobacteria bacterium]HRW80365.1 asparaginase domain-containing protein [Desulfomonilia bacterium]HNS89383.1 asparaginase domain-containing protein [Deltaproteobacteria bacterium]HOA44019.1 asparaginase domain-containing protein [Deltaproteobacteria bacterium]